MLHSCWNTGALTPAQKNPVCFATSVAKQTGYPTSLNLFFLVHLYFLFQILAHPLIKYFCIFNTRIIVCPIFEMLSPFTAILACH